MSQFISSLPLVGRLLGYGLENQAVRLTPVEVHAVENSAEKRPRTLKHLLRANHVNHALVYGRRFRCHNSLPHVLCSAYLLSADVGAGAGAGASTDQLHNIYEVVGRNLPSWTPSPAEVTDCDWQDFRGDGRYQRAYVDFFEDVLASHTVSYDWKRVVDMFLLAGPEPLVNSLISGVAHPLIRLAYAYEMDSRVLAMEGLALAAVSYDFLHRYTDDPSYTRPPPPPPSSDKADGSASPLLDLLARVAGDQRFDAAVPVSEEGEEGETNSDFNNSSLSSIETTLQSLLASPATEAALLEYWNAWDAAGDPTRQFRHVQETAVALLVASVPPGTHSYRWALGQLLAASHAARVLLPHLPAQYHVPLLRQWWLLALAVYVAVGRPPVDPDNVPAGGRGGRGWSHVEAQALTSPRWSTDVQYVQAVRAMVEAARTWGDVHDRYLEAAVRFVDDFAGWI